MKTLNQIMVDSLLAPNDVKKIILGPEEFKQYEKEISDITGGGDSHHFYGGGGEMIVEQMDEPGIKFV